MRVGLRKLWSLVVDWPVQSDHVRIRERDFLRWVSPGFTVVLTCELVKVGGAPAAERR